MIEVRDLTVEINGAAVVSNVSLQLSPGKLHILAGRVGSGKTLLAHTLAGLVRPTGGSISGIRAADDGRRRRSGGNKPDVALVFQNAHSGLVGESVMDDVALSFRSRGFTRSTANEHARALLDQLNLSELSDRPTYALSGGETRLTALAAAFAVQPRLLIVDEPFANLDWPSIQLVLGLLLEVKSNRCAVLVLTHEVEKVLAHAAHLYVLDGGRLAFSIDLRAGGDLSAEEREGLEKAGLRIRGPVTGQTWLEGSTHRSAP